MNVRADRRDKAIGAGDALTLVFLCCASNLLDVLHFFPGVADEPYTLACSSVSFVIGWALYALVP